MFAGVVFVLCIAVWLGFICYNVGCTVGCLRERKKWKEKARLLGYHEIQDWE